MQTKVAHIYRTLSNSTLTLLKQATLRQTSRNRQGILNIFNFLSKFSNIRSEEQLCNRTNGIVSSSIFDPTGRGPNFDAHKLAVIEKLMGQAFLGARL
jgi:hypothetical protein